MISKSDYCIKGLTVSFITKQHVFTVNFSLISNLRETVQFFSWYLSEESVVESHQGATIVVINVQGFPHFPGWGSGYIHVGLFLCDVIAASFFLSHLFFFLIHDSSQLAHWHEKWVWRMWKLELYGPRFIPGGRCGCRIGSAGYSKSNSKVVNPIHCRIWNCSLYTFPLTKLLLFFHTTLLCRSL